MQAAKQIIVMDNGKVAEIGSHDELVNKNGMYADLVSSQSLSLSLSVWFLAKLSTNYLFGYKISADMPES